MNLADIGADWDEPKMRFSLFGCSEELCRVKADLVVHNNNVLVQEPILNCFLIVTIANSAHLETDCELFASRSVEVSTDGVVFWFRANELLLPFIRQVFVIRMQRVVSIQTQFIILAGMRDELRCFLVDLAVILTPSVLLEYELSVFSKVTGRLCLVVIRSDSCCDKEAILV